ncbi:MAG: substrate-binding domain-containing protein [Fibrobacterota bacterium]|nr:substrate-binding domain-containing protein [Fibrobacterota bacterium]
MAVTAVDKALEYLLRILDSGAGKGGSPLPTLSVLSKAARVSRVSMWKAVGVLKKRGLLSAMRGGRITLSQNSATGSPTQPDWGENFASRLKWQTAHTALAQDIHSGHFTSGTLLPKAGSLLLRYGISHPTLRKVLGTAVAAGELTPEGKQFRVPVLMFRGRSPYASITLVAATGAKGEFGVFSDHGLSFLEALEAECSRANVRLEVLKLEPDRVHLALKSLRHRPETLGFILWPGEWPGQSESLGKIREILSVLTATGKSVAVLDEMGGFPPALFSRTRTLCPRVRIFTISAFRAGLAMAEHLLQLGHRRIGFLSPHQKLWWSDQRFQGLCRGFAEAGHGGGVLPFAVDFDRKYNRVLQSGSFDKGDSAAAGLFTGILRRQLGKGGERNEAVERALRENVFPKLLVDLKFTVLDRYFEGEIVRAMIPLFQKAWEMKNLTAWVGANDATALAAHAFLRERKRRVPGDVSVAGFDNTPASFETGLTSYHFHITRFPRILLGFLLESEHGDRIPGKGPEEVEGVLLARRSTGTAGGSGRQKPGKIAQGSRPG